MLALALDAQYGPAAAIDSCPACHLIWFDELESMRLSGRGWVELLRHMIESPRGLPPTAGVQLECPRCRRPLHTQHNQTRFGHYTQEACPDCRGHAQGQALLLAERGLFRRLLPADHSALQREGKIPECLHCGAPLEVGLAHCRHCRAPALLVDLPRLLQAVMLRAGHLLQARDAAVPMAWSCQACGQALDATRHPHCPQCQHPVLLPSLAPLLPLLQTLLAQREQLPRHQPTAVTPPAEAPDWHHPLIHTRDRSPGPRPGLWVLLRFGLPLLLMVAALLLLRCSRG